MTRDEPNLSGPMFATPPHFGIQPSVAFMQRNRVLNLEDAVRNEFCGSGSPTSLHGESRH